MLILDDSAYDKPHGPSKGDSSSLTARPLDYEEMRRKMLSEDDDADLFS
jgi:hypothetical protein